MPARQDVAIVFIHGLAKKPAPDKLKEIWLWGLGRDNPMPSVFAPPNTGLKLADEGVPHTFNYYADVFYGEDYETDVRSYYEQNEALEIAQEGLDGIEPALPLPVPQTAREAAFLAGFEAKLQAQMALLPSVPPPVPIGSGQGESLEILSWLPDAVKQAVIKKAAMEAYYFLFDKEYKRADGKRFRVRNELRSRLLRQLLKAAEQADRTVIVSHSMGTMVAYDMLRRCPECPPIDTLFTLGSPLGIQEVQDELKADGTSSVDFPAANLQRWINVYDPLDPVCGADPKFANDYRSVDGKSVQDVKESNWGNWRHSITHYLAGSALRSHLVQACGPG